MSDEKTRTADHSESDGSGPTEPRTAATPLRVERLKIRTLKRLKGGHGASDAVAGSATNDCSCSCPE
jgi:hypothetical protein